MLTPIFIKFYWLLFPVYRWVTITYLILLNLLKFITNYATFIFHNSFFLVRWILNLWINLFFCWYLFIYCFRVYMPPISIFIVLNIILIHGINCRNINTRISWYYLFKIILRALTYENTLLQSNSIVLLILLNVYGL